MAKRRNPKRILTTGDIAEYCHVNPATVFRWIKAGKIRAYSTPGGHHRVHVNHFIKFLEEHNMPVEEDFFGKPVHRVLIVDDDKQVVDIIKRTLRKMELTAKIETE